MPHPPPPPPPKSLENQLIAGGSLYLLKALNGASGGRIYQLNEGNCERDAIDRMEPLAFGLGGKRLRHADLVR